MTENFRKLNSSSKQTMQLKEKNASFEVGLLNQQVDISEQIYLQQKSTNQKDIIEEPGHTESDESKLSVWSREYFKNSQAASNIPEGRILEFI